MKQEIHFKGLSLTPDNHHAEVGALSLCANAELHDGALRVSVLPHTVIVGKLRVPQDKTVSTPTFYPDFTSKLRYIHQGNGYTHYIGTFIHTSDPEADDVYWYKSDGTYGGYLSGVTASKISEIQAVGNTLIFVCTDGVHYALWKDNTYKYLGQKPPFVELQFSLANYEYSGAIIQELNTDRNAMYDLEHQSGLTVPIKEEYRSIFTENAMALINRVHSEITEAGAFYAPFYVRYFYRLYDGTSFILHSPPVLMPVAIGHEDFIIALGLKVDNVGNPPTGRIIIDENTENDLRLSPSTGTSKPIAAKLKYRCTSSDNFQELQNNWSDIVSSIDIFISPPITRTRQGETFKNVSKKSASDTWRLIDGSVSDVAISGRVYANIPELEEDAYKSKLMAPDVFFKVASFSLKDQLNNSLTEVPIQGSVLSALTAQERMQDDYRTHHTLQADSLDGSHSYVYNRRLHLFGIKEKLFHGFEADVIAPYCYNADYFISDIYVLLATEDGDKVVRVQCNEVPFHSSLLNSLPLFYPDSRAYSMIINYYEGDSYKLKELPMSKLPLLEGAVTTGISMTFGGSVPSVADLVSIPNKIYVSEANNPFFFPLEGRQTVGIGRIVGLAVTTLALSPSQFGMFPLIVFCTDGIWTLDVSATGAYSSVHLISNEVCVNDKSICQLDQSVLFATQRGLSRIVGSTVTSVSDALDGPLFDVKTKMFNNIQLNQDVETLLEFNDQPFKFFKECMFLYDFVNSRVLAVKPNTATAYVLSLSGGTWSTMLVTAPLAIAKAYPYPYYQISDGTLWHLDKSYNYSDNNTYYALVVTRSLSFSATMQVIQVFQQINDCGTTPKLYIHGSNDDINWKLIGYAQRNHAPYLPGHPYRFFRLSVYLQMKTYEKYSSLILDVIEKYQKL